MNIEGCMLHAAGSVRRTQQDLLHRDAEAGKRRAHHFDAGGEHERLPSHLDRSAIAKAHPATLRHRRPRAQSVAAQIGE